MTRSGPEAALETGPDARGARLLVIVPCLDEERTVGQVVAGLPRSLPGVAELEVLVIDDGSADATAERAREAGASVLRHAVNLGLGESFRRGVREALARGADILVNIDGDGQFDPTSVGELIEPIVRGEAHMVTASRFLDPALTPRMPAIKRWGNRQVARIVRLLTGKRFHDVSCGFRAFSREALLRMNLYGSFTYTHETFMDLVFKGMSIREIPLPVRGSREFGESRMASSIPRYAWRSLQIMVRAFIAYRPFTFFASIAAGFFVGGLALLGFLLWHYIQTGAFSPHRWAGFVGGALSFVGLITLVLGILGDLLVRLRRNQEEILYFLRQGSEADPR
jgi:glycosyltransferase involved in cell wall biosynthesis